MSTQLTQGVVNRISNDYPAGTQLYDQDVSGLRIVVGSKSSSWKLMARINDGTARYVSIIIGRVNEVSLKTARERAIELKLALRRGEDPRHQKASVPTLSEALDRYLTSRTDLKRRVDRSGAQKEAPAPVGQAS